MTKNLDVLQNLRESYQIFISDKLKISDGSCGRGVFSSAVLEQSELLIRLCNSTSAHKRNEKLNKNTFLRKVTKHRKIQKYAIFSKHFIFDPKNRASH